MKTCFSFGRTISALLISGMFTLLADLGFAFWGKTLPFPLFLACFLLPAALLICLRRKTGILWLCLSSALILSGILAGCLLFVFRSQAAYQVHDSGKSALYANRNVLVLVPHEDDELIVAGGVMEEYVKYGSQLSLCFVTNGDYSTPGETRMTEALAVARAIGIPEDQVYFLGYADRDTAHLYMSPEGKLISSNAGYSATYGLPEHPAYRQGQEYRRENLLADLTELLLQLQPDLIYCTEVEEHMDHSAVSLFLDEAMEKILKDRKDYRPVILKSSCYATAFYADADFYAPNLLATKDPTGNEHFADLYNWEDRIRLPLDPSGLSRSIYDCKSFQHIQLHRSQKIGSLAEGIISGDRVFWLRDTQSLCYNARVETSSGFARFLNDFKLCNNFDLYRDFKWLSDNTWVPDPEDQARQVCITLDEPSAIYRICLYDDPAADSNVCNARITFDDGSSLETGPLNPNGSATSILVNRARVSSFTVELLETQGPRAGLTEIEAYAQPHNYGLDFIKLQDLEGNFVYDYHIDPSGQQEFEIYASGAVGPWQIQCDNSLCSAVLENDRLLVFCPPDESCNITVISSDGRCADTVRISNPGRFLRYTGPQLEKLVRLFPQANMHRSNCYQILKAGYHALIQ